jgi:hypothetical protein
MHFWSPIFVLKKWDFDSPIFKNQLFGLLEFWSPYFIFWQPNVSASAETEPVGLTQKTPAKRTASDAQLSSTKSGKHIKNEKWCYLFDYFWKIATDVVLFCFVSLHLSISIRHLWITISSTYLDCFVQLFSNLRSAKTWRNGFELYFARCITLTATSDDFRCLVSLWQISCIADC